MAIAGIGGLITSTLPSLIVDPAVVTNGDDAAHWIGRIAGRRGPKRAVSMLA